MLVSMQALCDSFPRLAGCGLASHVTDDGRRLRIFYYVAADGVAIDDGELSRHLMDAFTPEQLPNLAIRVTALPAGLECEYQSTSLVSREGAPDSNGLTGVDECEWLDVATIRQRQGSSPAYFFIAGHSIYDDIIERLPRGRAVISVCLRWKITCLTTDIAQSTALELVNFQIIVERYLALIQKHQPHGPYVLAGMSFGGLVALELARRLEAQGEKVELVCMLDTYPTPGQAKLGRFEKAMAHFSMMRREGAGYLLEKFKARRMAKISSALKIDIPETEIHLKSFIDRDLGAASFPERFSYGGDVMLFNPRIREPFAPKLSGYGWENSIAKLQVVKVPGRHHTLMQLGADVIAKEMVNCLQVTSSASEEASIAFS